MFGLSAKSNFCLQSGNRSRSMRGFPGAMSNFEQWEGPDGNRKLGVSVEHRLVPANKTDLVIGKGNIGYAVTGPVVQWRKQVFFYPDGDTIKQINMQCGAHAAHNFALQNPLQSPLQVQPGQDFQQQPWPRQLQQWTSPSASGAFAAQQGKFSLLNWLMCFNN